VLCVLISATGTRHRHSAGFSFAGARPYIDRQIDGAIQRLGSLPSPDVAEIKELHGRASVAETIRNLARMSAYHPQPGQFPVSPWMAG